MNKQGGKPRATRWYICTHCDDIYHNGGGYVPPNKPKSKTDPALIRRWCGACPKKIKIKMSNTQRQINKKDKKIKAGLVRIESWVREKDYGEVKALERLSQGLHRDGIRLRHYRSQS